MPDKHIIYRTTNLVNSKYYVGKHTLGGARSDEYLGSGVALKAAIKKYGRDNFVRETLFEFSSFEDCMTKEQKVVNSTLVNDPECYNISTGGMGGRTQNASTRKLISSAVQKEWDNNAERRTQAKELMTKRVENGISGTKTWTAKSYKNIGTATKERWSDDAYKNRVSKAISKGHLGVPLSEEHRLANKAAQNRTRHCVYCDQHPKLAAYGRWHGIKCKENK